MAWWTMRAKKRFGQHFLQPEWAEKLVEAIAPSSEDRFLEIGAGPGALTLRLASRVASVIAIEVDPEMVRLLAPRVPANVTILQQDILEVNLLPMLVGGPLRVAGNLPYNISSAILFRLVGVHRSHGGLTDATLMLQREVADRLHAVPGTKDYGVLSILIGLHADVRNILALPPGAFRPAPKVHSSVVRLTFRPPLVPLANESILERMVRSMFMQRRKTLSNALKPFADSRGVRVSDALAEAAIDRMRRPETLQLSELARLAEFFAAARE